MENALGIVSCHLKFDELAEAFEKVCRLGLDTIEWFESGRPLFSEPDSAAKIVKLSRQCGVTASYHAPYTGSADLGRLPLEDAQKRVKDMLMRAERLGAKRMTIHLGSYDPLVSRSEVLERIIAAIGHSIPLAGQLGIRICVENFTRCYGATDMGDRTADFDRLFEALDAPAIGLNLDVGHANITGNLVELVTRFNHRLYNTHLHDTDGMTDGHLPPGQGTVDWDGLLSLLTEAHYQGPLNFEFPEASGAYPGLVAKIRAFK